MDQKSGIIIHNIICNSDVNIYLASASVKDVSHIHLGLSRLAKAYMREAHWRRSLHTDFPADSIDAHTHAHYALYNRAYFGRINFRSWVIIHTKIGPLKFFSQYSTYLWLGPQKGKPNAIDVHIACNVPALHW